MRLKTIYRAALAATLSTPLFLNASVDTYDAAIAADHGGGEGSFPYEAILTEAVEFDGETGEAFDFGDVSGDATFEFILEGDPIDGGQNGFLGVGENTGNSLRYEQWDDTGELGYTRSGVADVTFVPEDDEDLLLSPEDPTHVTYQWTDEDSKMDLYVDGILAGSNEGIVFEMPFGEGFLGNNAGGTEGMLGTIHRVTIYDSLVPADTIKAHADAWLAPDTDPSIQVGLAVTLALTGAQQEFPLNVLNAGEANTLNVTGISFAGVDAAKFSTTTAVPFAVAPGGQAPIAFSFDPAGATGVFAAQLIITSDDPQRAEVMVELSGIIRDPELKLAAEALDFGDAEGTVTRSLEISNEGATQELVVSAIAFSGPEGSSFSAPTPAPVAVGASGQIMVTFTPGDATGSFDAVMEISSNDAASPVTTVPLTAFVPLQDATFVAYDAAIAADNGTYPYAALLREPATFDGEEAAEFDFGDISDDATFEFILEGDPEGGGRDGFLAVGEAPADNLRYEQWDDTGMLGFTRLGVADNVFVAEDDEDLLLSPEVPTHVTYAWNAEDSIMELYINGELAGTNDGAEFAMPSGVGWIGAKNDAGAEGMLGTIHRVVTYDTLLPSDVIARHALAFTNPGSLAPFVIFSISADPAGKTATITWPSTPGSTFLVENSLDLNTWLELDDGLPATDGDETSYTDTTLTGEETELYYRVTRD